MRALPGQGDRLSVGAPFHTLEVSLAFVLRSRSARTFITASAKCGVSCTIYWNRRRSTGTSRQSVFATTVALRGSSSISANSPTMEPGPAVSKYDRSVHDFDLPFGDDVHCLLQDLPT